MDGREREYARSLSSGAHSRDPLALLPGHDEWTVTARRGCF